MIFIVPPFFCAYNQFSAFLSLIFPWKIKQIRRFNGEALRAAVLRDELWAEVFKTFNLMTIDNFDEFDLAAIVNEALVKVPTEW